MQRKSTDILNELRNHFGGHKYHLTDFDNSDVNLETNDEFRIVIENPYNEENLYIDVMFGEITVFLECIIHTFLLIGCIKI